LPDIVSADARASIDYRIIVLIFAGILGFHFFLNGIESEDDIEISVTIISIASPLAVGIAALVISKRYWKSDVLGKSYLALATAFLFVCLGEISYILLEFVFNIDPYPSFADIFFFLLYPLSMIHLIINIRFFAEKITMASLLGIVALASILTLSYSYFAFVETQEFNFDSAYGIIFIIGSSAVLSTAIFGAKVMSKIPLGRAWLILLFGIAVGMVGDFWYQLLEISGSYTVVHIVNLTWYCSYWIIVYSLIKHGKII